MHNLMRCSGKIALLVVFEPIRCAAVVLGRKALWESCCSNHLIAAAIQLASIAIYGGHKRDEFSCQWSTFSDISVNRKQPLLFY